MKHLQKETENACAMWDFRLSAKDVTSDSVIAQLDEIAKRWTFQLEKGDTTDYLHYQGRISLIKKHRKCELMKLFDSIPVPEYLQPTSNPVQKAGDTFYVTKKETRVDGPWSDSHSEVYIPKHVKGFMDRLYPFQQVIWNECQNPPPFNRSINLIYDHNGSCGKSTIGSICELYGKGINLPAINDSERIIQMLYCICSSKKLRNPNPIIMDMPRAMDKSRLNGVYSAIEQIKTGKLYDLRYSYREWWIEQPEIWVFSNIPPDTAYLSRDRWKIWTIDVSHNLVKYDPNECHLCQ